METVWRSLLKRAAGQGIKMPCTGLKSERRWRRPTRPATPSLDEARARLHGAHSVAGRSRCGGRPGISSTWAGDVDPLWRRRHAPGADARRPFGNACTVQRVGSSGHVFLSSFKDWFGSTTWTRRCRSSCWRTSTVPRPLRPRRATSCGRSASGQHRGIASRDPR